MLKYIVHYDGGASRLQSAPEIHFLLSPARCDGARAKVVMSERATFPLATQFRSEHGAPLGDIFAFMSGLYFRGKLTYARAFTPPDARGKNIRIITTNRGLLAPDVLVHADDLRAFSDVDLARPDARYLEPLQRDAAEIARSIPENAAVVLLGSIATGKYVDLLISVFAERLLFPSAFVGRGDMSRGGLLLRHAASGEPLEYAPVLGAVRRGVRRPKLPPIR